MQRRWGSVSWRRRPFWRRRRLRAGLPKPAKSARRSGPGRGAASGRHDWHSCPGQQRGYKGICQSDTRLGEAGVSAEVRRFLLRQLRLLLKADDDWEEGDFRLPEVLERYARLTGKPMIKGVPVGHGKDNVFLPFGVYAVMKANADGTASLRLDEAALRIGE